MAPATASAHYPQTPDPIMACGRLNTDHPNNPNPNNTSIKGLY